MATSTLTATNHYTTFLNTEMSPTSAYAWKRTDFARQGAYHDSTITTDEGESQLGIIQFSHGLTIHPSQITAIKIKATYAGGSGLARTIKFYTSLKSLDTGDNNGRNYLGSELGSYDIGATNNTKTTSLTSGTLFNNLKKYLCCGSNSFAICTYNQETCGTSGTTYSTNYIGLKAVSIEVTYTDVTSYTITVDPAGGTMTYLANGSTTTSSTSRTLKSTVPYFPISTDGVSWGISITEYNHAYYQGGQFICGQPSKTGYTFKGWSSTSGTVTKLTNVTIGGVLYGAIYSLANPGKNVTITAQWEAIVTTYTATVNANNGTMKYNGSSVSSCSIDFKSNANYVAFCTGTSSGVNIASGSYSAAFFGAVKIPSVPTRTGYTFNGWTTNSGKTVSKGSGFGSPTSWDGTDYFYPYFIDNPQKSFTATANWTINTYTITYNANGGSGSMTNGTKTYGTAYTLKSNSFTAPASTVTSRTIYCYNNDGTSNYITKQYNRTTPKTFKQWRLNSTSGTVYAAGSSYTTNAAATFYAEWQNGTTTGSTTLPTASQCTRTGYTLLGWATSSTATSASYSPGATYTGTSNLYAVWQSNSYTIQYKSNGGSGTMTNGTKTHGTAYTLKSNSFTAPSSTSNTYTIYLKQNDGTSAQTTKTCTRTTSYSFKQWRLNSTSGTAYAAGSSYTTNAAATFYAEWQSSTTGSVNLGTASRSNTTSNGYTITFAPNGGTTTKSSQTAIDTTSYSFSEWNTNKYGEGQEYQANATYYPSSSSTLYAIWDETFSYGSVTLPTKSQCTRTGYVLLGWATSSTATSPTYDPGAVYTPSSEQTLHAVWQAKQLTVTYHKNNPDGTTESTATQTFTYDSVGTRRFGYKDNSNDKKWSSPNNYAASYGFGQWYFPGYKIIGWGDNRTTAAYTSNAPYTNVSNNWIDSNVGNAATGTKDIYAIWDYNGVVRIYHDGEWKYAIPYIYNGSSWQYGIPYVYKNSTDGWKMNT